MPGGQHRLLGLLLGAGAWSLDTAVSLGVGLLDGHEGVDLAHVYLEGFVRLHDDTAARHAVDDDLERRIEAHVLDQLGARGLLWQRVPVLIVRQLAACWVDRGVAQPEREEVLEKVRALREGHVLRARHLCLDDECGGVDVGPGDGDALALVSRTPPTGCHQQALASLGTQQRVDLVDLLGNLGGARGVEEVRRHVDHVGDLLEATVAERVLGGHAGVLLGGQVAEARRRAACAEPRLRPQLQHVELVLARTILAQLERELDLDGAAQPRRAEAQQEGKRARQRGLAAECPLERQVQRLDRLSGRGSGVAVARLEDDLLAVDVLRERHRGHSLGRGHAGAQLGHGCEREECGARVRRELHELFVHTARLGGEVESGHAHLAWEEARDGQLGISERDMHRRHVVDHAKSQPQRELRAAVIGQGVRPRVEVDRVGDAGERGVVVPVAFLAHDLLHDDGHLLLLHPVVGALQVLPRLLAEGGRVDHAHGPP
mmetsp:Transcript_65963/g.159128  ORF Transcript_65963/g.159128 Transcript_65963/m.159128 type:complete len:488 (-) Transcript_65963:580-2043(-)